MTQFIDTLVGIFQSSGFAPVSYTHLDVYKRQALYHRSGSGRLLSGNDSPGQ